MEKISAARFTVEDSSAVGGGTEVAAFFLSFASFVPAMSGPKFYDLLSESLMIVEDPAICGGAPTLRGTRLSVHHLIAQMKALGWTRERLIESYPHLSLEQADGVLRFYEGHRAQIDDLIQREDALGV